MATTLKKSISPDSPQCKEQCVAIKTSIFTKFSKIHSICNILLQTIFRTVPHFLTLGVTVLNTINTHKFHLSIISGSKFKIPSQYFAITFGFSKFLSAYIFFTRCLACIVSPTVSFKNSLTNNCCLGTSTASPWAKATFLYMYFFQYATYQNVMEEEHTKEPSHNNPEEAANYVKAVNTLLQSFVSDIRGFNRYA